VAFVVLFPVLYTDTNEAWKLPGKQERLAIAAAGMLYAGVMHLQARSNSIAGSYLRRAIATVQREMGL
jgi:hypothetical protein